MPSLNKPDLADVLAHIATQLIAADEAASARGRAAMKFEECEVELAVRVEAGAKGSFKVWVVEAGADGKYEQSNRIKVKFKAMPDFPMVAR